MNDDVFQWIRTKAGKFPHTLWMSQGTRGAIIGRIEDAIQAAAHAIPLPVSSGRDIRLRLASEIFEREISTFNELGDDELWALDQWVLWEEARGLEDWLRQTYGEQIPLL